MAHFTINSSKWLVATEWTVQPGAWIFSFFLIRCYGLLICTSPSPKRKLCNLAGYNIRKWCAWITVASRWWKCMWLIHGSNATFPLHLASLPGDISIQKETITETEEGEVIELKRKRRLHMESGNFLAQKGRKKLSVSTSLLNCLKESNPILLAS